MDKAARAAQIARCVAHTGDLLTFEGGSPFAANITPDTSEPSPLTRDGSKLAAVRVSFARAVLGTAQPGAGEFFRDAEGNKYRITKPLSHPLQPLAVYLCTVSAPAT